MQYVSKYARFKKLFVLGFEPNPSLLAVWKIMLFQRTFKNNSYDSLLLKTSQSFQTAYKQFIKSNLFLPNICKKLRTEFSLTLMGQKSIYIRSGFFFSQILLSIYIWLCVLYMDSYKYCVNAWVDGAGKLTIIARKATNPNIKIYILVFN